MKIGFVSFLLCCVLLIISTEISYAKLLPQASGKKTVSSYSGAGIATVNVSPRLRADRKALLVYFNGLTNATSISYTLIYNQNGQDEGAGGSITPDSTSASRELLFGTCSHGVCRYHSNIKNMKFEVVAELKSGKTIKKRYRINV